MKKMIGLVSLAAIQALGLGISVYGIHNSAIGLEATMDQINEEATRIGRERQAKKAQK